MSSANKVRCTYASCGLYFDSSNDMQSHKTIADKHHYCLKHDLDFPNAALLHLHKIMSEEHFACVECDLELRSEAGLKHHAKITHQGDKEVACLGCGRRYKSAAAVMKHIEDNECPFLSLPERGPCESNFDIFGGESIMEMGRSSPGLSPTDVPSDDDDPEGGVLLDITTEPCAPVPSPGAALSSQQWPNMRSMGSTREKSDSTSTESTGGISLIPTGSLLDQDIPISTPIISVAQDIEEDLRAITSSGDQELSFLAGLGSPRPNAHGNRAVVNPEDFWNASRGRYICNCNASFLHVSTFIHHIAEEDDSILDCPRCGKRFPTHAAQVAHVEAPYSKCAVRSTPAEIEKDLSEITRGFAEIKSHDQQEYEDADDVMESSQPSNDTYGSTDDATEHALDTVEGDVHEDDVVEEEFFQHALEYVVEDTTDTSVDDMLAQGLRGLVFSTKEDGVKKEGN